MANVLGELFQNIADAIRSKTGSTDTLKPNEFPAAIEGITAGGGGSSADERVKYVTFVYEENGETKEHSYPVISGDTCRDPVANGFISTPTKESTAQYNYTFYGWGASDGGAADANILKNITEDKTVYAIFTATVRYYTISYLDFDGATVLNTESLPYGAVPSYTPSKDGYIFSGWTPTLVAVTGNATYTAQWVESNLGMMTWEEIAQISEAGTAANYFAVGDTKAIHLSGTMGTLALDTTLHVYILSLDHNSDVEGKGIHFGGFKTESGTSGIDVCLVNNYRDLGGTVDGTKNFNMNHWGSSNYGGWKGCDMRYDILGSTDVAPSGYGAAKTVDVVGYDATETCATNPVPNTLMSCLPADLRAVMKPITKFTNNVGGKGGNIADRITASVDYLPLLAEFEAYGRRCYANNYEKNYQKKYKYFVDGNSNIKYKHSAHGEEAYWWFRSPNYNNDYFFCRKSDEDRGSDSQAYFILGVAPVFMV